jgi:uncharacterized membrane protein
MLDSGSKGRICINSEYVWLLVILIFAAFFRLKGLNFQSLWGDELFSIYHSSPDFSLFRILGVSRWDPHPPLFLLLLHGWMKLFGYNEFSPRLFVAVIGILSVFPVFLLAKEIYNRNSGIIAGLLVSTNFYHLYYSQEVRPYILLFMFSTLSFLFFIRDLRQPGRISRRLFILFSLLMLYTHYYGLFILLAQFVYLIIHYGVKKKLFDLKALKRHFVTGLMISALYAPMIYFVLKMMRRTDHWIKEPPEPFFFLKLISAFFGGDAYLVFLFSGLTLFLILTCLLRYRKNSASDYEFARLIFACPILVSWMFLSVLFPYLRSLMVVPMLSFKHGIYILAAVLVLIASAVSLIRPPVLRGVIVVAALILSITSICFRHDYYTRKTKQQWREAAIRIMESVPVNPDNSIAIFADEIRYSRCYFDLLKRKVDVLAPTFLNLKNVLKNQTGPSLTLMLMDWEEQPIGDKRFTDLISGYFTIVGTSRYMSISVLEYHASEMQLEQLKMLLKIS